MTSTKLRSLLLGTSLVNILQSSHAVSLIILALVWSGIIALNQAIAVVIGMNIGSVFMEALIWLFGLWFDMKPIVMPMIAIGWLGAFFSKKYRTLFLILMSLWLVFLWLEYMKDSIKFLKESIDISQYTHIGRGWFILIGLIGTIMTQSSSATTIIVMTALNQHIIWFEGAGAMLMGAYIGSSTTALIVAFLSGSAIKKQVAMSHFGFNIVTCILFVLCYPVITHYIVDIRWFGSNTPRFWWLIKSSVNGLIIFFLLFKIIGGIIHIPFINTIARILTYLIPNNTIHHLGIEHTDSKINLHIAVSILYTDLLHFWEQHCASIYQRFTNPSSYSEEIYTTQQNDYNTLFHYIVQFPFDRLYTNQIHSNTNNNSQGVELMDSLQKTMQALTLCKNSVASLKNIQDTPDNQSQSYLTQLHQSITLIIDKLKNNESASARIHAAEFMQRDDQQIHTLLQEGTIPSPWVIELLQVHDYIYESLINLIEVKEQLEKIA